jgi:predicted DNA-binding transcriptional regulator
MKKKLSSVDKILKNTNEETTLYEWTAAERAFKKRDKDFWITAISILVLFSVVLVFLGEFLLIMALVSILFLYYVLSTVPPQEIKYKITNWGVHFGDSKYDWNILLRFWFRKSLDTELLEFETNLRIPRQISFVINQADEEMIKGILLKKLPLVESSPNFIDKTTKWWNDKMPWEKRDK